MSMHAGRRVYAGNDLPRLGAVEEALPAEWDAGVKTLAGKIATAMKPERAISLEVKNISSLGAGDVERIRRGLEAELRGKGIRLGAAEMAVTVTLSENLEGYVWVAEVHRAEVKDAKERKLEGEPRVMIIAVKKPVDSAAEKSALLVLAKRRVWQQPGRMLDFAIVTGAPAGRLADFWCSVRILLRSTKESMRDGNWNERYRFLTALPGRETRAPGSTPPGIARTSPELYAAGTFCKRIQCDVSARIRTAPGVN